MGSREDRSASIPTAMYILGIDLSGPRNIADTHCAVFRETRTTLQFIRALRGADDRQILEAVSNLGQSERVIVGIDAPLSYNSGGGDRPSDRALRRFAQEHGGGVGIMPPTMIRMVYLTLRGIALARELESLKPRIDLRIVEVHPGAAMLLRDAPRRQLTSMKRELSARLDVLRWLQTQGLQDVPGADDPADHFVMACAAALAAWKWEGGKPAWRFPASPPDHPYDFAC